jgi:sialidase-1
VTATIYSDDYGKTWKAGDIAVPCTEEWINPNETVAIELNDGRVMLNVRSESKAHCRLVVTSPDGATNWSTPKFEDAMLEPICMAGIVRYKHSGQNLILFSNPHNLEVAKGNPEPGKSRARKNVSIKISRDDGQTWPLTKLLENGPSAYSDIGVTQNGTILCFYGRAGDGTGMLAWSGARLTLARFNLEWLLQQ